MYSSPAGSSRHLSSQAHGHAGWTEHIYSLTTSRDVAWAKLKVRSRARSPSHLPSFFEGEELSGEVHLDLEREDSIKSISVSVRTCS